MLQVSLLINNIICFFSSSLQPNPTDEQSGNGGKGIINLAEVQAFDADTGKLMKPVGITGNTDHPTVRRHCYSMWKARPINMQRVVGQCVGIFLEMRTDTCPESKDGERIQTIHRASCMIVISCCSSSREGTQ